MKKMSQNLKQILKIIKKYKIQIICIIIIILSIISVIIQYIDKNNNMKVNSKDVTSKDEKIAVYVNGAVKNSGVYYLNSGARMYELLDLCGGVTEKADINNINLAKKLADSDMITIPEKNIKSNILDENDETEYDNLFDEVDTKSDGKVNINTASKSELMSINGIGEQTANKIIEYRSTTKFNEIEDIMNVNGIGSSKFENIKNYICVY